MDSDNHPTTLCLLYSQEPPKAYNVLRTFQSPSEPISPVGIGFCFVVPAQLYQSAARLEQNTAKGWMMNILQNIVIIWCNELPKQGVREMGKTIAVKASLNSNWISHLSANAQR